MKNSLTEGKVIRVLIMFAIPYMLSSFLQTLYGMADLYIVGQYNGADALSAVSIGSQFMHMLTVIIIGLAMGSTVRLGNAIGREDEKDASFIVGNTILLFMGVSIVFTVILLCNISLIVQWMSTPQEAIAYTTSYLKVCFVGIPFIFAYNVMSSLLRGSGDSKSPMYFVFIACIMNVFLDYLFVGYFSMGATGAALATVLAQALSFIVGLFFIFVKKPFYFSIHKSDFQWHLQTMKDIVVSGLPIALQDGFIQISFLIITIIANSRGLIFATGVGITEKIISFLFLIPSSFLSALSVCVAQNIGAKKRKRAQQMLYYGLMITVSFGVISAIICQIFPKQMIGLFTYDREGIDAGSLYLMAYAWDCIFASVHFCFSGYFCGCNKAMISFIHNIISILCVRIPGAYLASQIFPNTLYPMGWAAPLGSILSGVICILFYLYLLKNETGNNRALA